MVDDGNGGWWWMTTVDGDERWRRTVVKVNGKRINWYEMKKYKIEEEKIRTK